MMRRTLTRQMLCDALMQRDNTVVNELVSSPQAIDVFSQPKHGYALTENGEIYAAFGIVPIWSGVGEAWMLPTVHLKRKKVSASRHMRIGLDELIGDLNMHRTQAAVKVDHEEAHRLVKFVGMREEGLMRRYGPDGSDYVRYAKWLS